MAKWKPLKGHVVVERRKESGFLRNPVTGELTSMSNTKPQWEMTAVILSVGEDVEQVKVGDTISAYFHDGRILEEFGENTETKETARAILALPVDEILAVKVD